VSPATRIVPSFEFCAVEMTRALRGLVAAPAVLGAVANATSAPSARTATATRPREVCQLDSYAPSVRINVSPRTMWRPGMYGRRPGRDCRVGPRSLPELQGREVGTLHGVAASGRDPFLPPGECRGIVQQSRVARPRTAPRNCRSSTGRTLSAKRRSCDSGSRASEGTPAMSWMRHRLTRGPVLV
jgi:hypothetical protein